MVTAIEAMNVLRNILAGSTLNVPFNVAMAHCQIVESALMREDTEREAVPAEAAQATTPALDGTY